MKPPKVTLPISRWMFSGHQLKLFILSHSVAVVSMNVLRSRPSADLTGVFMNEVGPSMTNSVTVPITLSRTPSAMCRSFSGPCRASHVYQ